MRYYATKTRTFKPGEMIFTENCEGDGMYIVNSGRVRVFKIAGTGSAAQEIELTILGPKAMFGEMAIIDDSKRSANVQALEATECTIITKKTFENQLQRIPPWMVNMIRILVQRLRETNDKLRLLAQQYTSVPNDDTGSVITIDAAKMEQVNMTAKSEIEEFNNAMKDAAFVHFKQPEKSP